MEELENEISTQAEENTVSLASAQALADALAKIEVYTPTTWVDNSSPDIDAEHLNKPEQAIKRVTDALNSAVDVIKDLQSQVTKNSGAISDVNNNLSNGSVLANFSPMQGNEANFCKGYDYNNKKFCFNYRGAESQIADYIFGDGKGGVIANLNDFVKKDDLGVFLTASGTKAAVFKDYVEITKLKLYAGHTYLILGKSESSRTVSLIAARIILPSSDYGSSFSLEMSRSTGANGGGCVTAAIITLTKDYAVPLQGYGYDNATYDYQGFLMAIQLK